MRQQIVEKGTEYVTNGVAVVGVSSVLWLEYVQTFFGALLPIMGCLWLGYQMYTHWHRKK